ncbi:hypothetical protein SCOR_34610 [Sulfidibacter corallicola]|uniref:Uncharacterized protein n=1 Tax=Sulfidibacter corallicola TaxID=2818388 RepID=A0A8A4TJK4_SULCO|nr:hypothetical protein [Sulfidibacter corallicola]QTD49332.1 hypothetical protein J3U87_27420 [Sulfidibacter corallicola]
MSYQGEVQDQLLIAVEFNRSEGGDEQGRKPTADELFDALAQYAAVEGPLWRLLDRLKKPDRDQDDTALFTALDTYADLAERVSAAWAAHWGGGAGEGDAGLPPAGGRPAEGRPAEYRPADLGLIHPSRRSPTRTEVKPLEHRIHNYLASFTTRNETGLLNALSLTQLDDDNRLGWPEVSVVLAGDIVVPLEGTDPLRSTRDYFFPEKVRVPVTAPRRLRLTFPKLHIAEVQNATTAVSVVHNARLLGASGPRTCSSFMFRTPESAFPQPLFPLIRVADPLVMKPWTGKGESEDDAFRAVLGTLFDERFEDRDIGFAIRYGYTLAEGDPPLQTFLPVALHPRTRVDDQTVPGVADTIEAWKEKVDPVQTGGCWSFDLSLYSTVNPDQTRPLLELKQLVFPVATA